MAHVIGKASGDVGAIVASPILYGRLLFQLPDRYIVRGHTQYVRVSPYLVNKKLAANKPVSQGISAVFRTRY